ncbi:MAG: saccharopine dehydrogenase C-terminal domain-containing protein [Thermoplasmatota archaeon]
MSFKYAVLGAGRQGTASAYDLAKFGDAEEIIIVDIDPDSAGAGTERINALAGREVARPVQGDVSMPDELKAKLEGVDAIIAGVHYPFNPGLTQMAIDIGANMVDFGGNTDIVRDQMKMTKEAEDAGISVVPDCGMGPGMNISLACYAMELLVDCEEVLIWDGGLPQDPRPPWNYAVSFNIGGLTNEYHGDAFFLKDGKVTPVPCFEGYEMVQFPEPIGELEAFVTSGGLSTAPWTFEGKLQRLENRTLRYPGHAAQFKAFRDLGLFEEDPVMINDTAISPRDFSHELLSPKITDPKMKDICVMRIKGTGKSREAIVELIDRYDDHTGFTAMQRITGWHASIMAILAAKGEVDKGVVPMESAVPGSRVVEEARKRGLSVTERIISYA